jgi:hypothetical protein
MQVVVMHSKFRLLHLNTWWLPVAFPYNYDDITTGATATSRVYSGNTLTRYSNGTGCRFSAADLMRRRSEAASAACNACAMARALLQLSGGVVGAA